MSAPTMSPDQMRRLVTSFRQGEQARAMIAQALDPHAIYSELPDPPPVFVIDKRGGLVEVKPVSLYQTPPPGQGR